MSLAVGPGGGAIETGGEHRFAVVAESIDPVSRLVAEDGRAVVAVMQTSTSAGRQGLWRTFQSVVNVTIVALFIITFTVQPFRIPSESMEPTLLVGDFMLVDKQVALQDTSHLFAPASVIHRGDVVVFHYPVDASLHLVKRVIGLPGDHLRMREGRVYIDGTPLREPYAIYRPGAADSYRDEFPRLVSADPGVDSRWWIQMHSLVSQGELTVPPDSYFVLGDNRNDSEDSRYWGFVPRSAIVGKPLLVYFSLNEPGSLPSQTGAMSGSQRQSSVDSLADFVRWDRVLHRIE